MQPDPVREGGAAGRGPDHLDLRRVVAGLHRAQGGACPRCAGLAGLVHRLGQHQVGDGVAQVTHLVDLAVDRLPLRGGRGGQARPAERVGGLPGGVDVADQSQAVDHRAGLEVLDRGPLGRGGRSESAGAQRESPAQVPDELVHLGEPGRVVQAALERVAEQLAERLTVAHAGQHLQRLAHPLGGQVDGEQPRLVGRGVGPVAAA